MTDEREGKAVGTIWVVTHDDQPDAPRFDSEDRRILVDLGKFASFAYQAVEQLQSLSKQAGFEVSLASRGPMRSPV